MLGKMSDQGTMLEKIMKSRRDAAENKESGHDAEKDNEIRASVGKVGIWASNGKGSE